MNAEAAEGCGAALLLAWLRGSVSVSRERQIEVVQEGGRVTRMFFFVVKEADG